MLQITLRLEARRFLTAAFFILDFQNFRIPFASMTYAHFCQSVLCATGIRHSPEGANFFEARGSDSFAHKPFRIRTYRSVDSRELKLFRMNTYKNRGEGGAASLARSVA
jgi:hypothetical protein